VKLQAGKELRNRLWNALQVSVWGKFAPCSSYPWAINGSLVMESLCQVGWFDYFKRTSRHTPGIQPSWLAIQLPCFSAITSLIEEDPPLTYSEAKLMLVMYFAFINLLVSEKAEGPT